MRSPTIQRRILRHPPEDITGAARLPLGTRATDHGSFTASVYHGVSKGDEVLDALAPHLRDDDSVSGQGEKAKRSMASAELTSAGSVENLEGQPVPSVADQSLNAVESATPREKLAVESDRRQARREPLRGVQRVPFAGDERRAIPQHPPSVQLFRKQPPGWIGTLPVFQEREHARTMPGIGRTSTKK